MDPAHNLLLPDTRVCTRVSEHSSVYFSELFSVLSVLLISSDFLSRMQGTRILV